VQLELNVIYVIAVTLKRYSDHIHTRIHFADHILTPMLHDAATRLLVILLYA
jgi:hypothetical protein